MRFSIDALRAAAADVWKRDAKLRAALGNESDWLTKVMKLEFAPKLRDSEIGIVSQLRNQLLIAPRQEAVTAAAQQEVAAKIIRDSVLKREAESQAQLGAQVTGASTASVEERCKAQWDASADLRNEFVSLANYTALVKAEEAGKVRVVAGHCKRYAADAATLNH